MKKFLGLIIIGVKAYNTWLRQIVKDVDSSMGKGRTWYENKAKKSKKVKNKSDWQRGFEAGLELHRNVLIQTLMKKSL